MSLIPSAPLKLAPCPHSLAVTRHGFAFYVADPISSILFLMLPISWKWEMGSYLNISFAVVIRCLLRFGSELRRAREMLNRYIDGGRKRDPTMDSRGIENSSRRIRSRRAWKPRGRRSPLAAASKL
jgi:hypothetical protein